MIFSSISVYETASLFYVVGHHATEEKYSLLKIDRTAAACDGLSCVEDDYVYSKTQLNELLQILGSVSASKKSNAVALAEKTKALALFGFVRFLEGFYMILITKGSIAAKLGYHTIYKIEDTALIYIPNDARSAVQNAADESRYLRLFQSVDLSSNFYFSYTYDLTKSLQENVTQQHDFDSSFDEKYVWNSYLMMANGLLFKWCIPAIHGYVNWSCLSLNGSTTCFILIARRSNKYAGTRFLKRGANFCGNVANEVETEQIVYEACVSDFTRGRYTSFVQLRGSVPLIWSQDQAKVVAKPPIQMDLSDPFAAVPLLHFQKLYVKYGSPVVVLNLVKRRERRQRESVLNDEFRDVVAYLNQFVDPKDSILYLNFDMARCSKTGNVLEKLEEIGYNVIRSNGWFQSFKPLYCHEIRPHRLMDGVTQKFVFTCDTQMAVQVGVVRTNCVDCTDRTNTAQFVIGKVALAFQLYALGVLEKPELGLETESCRILETLYEEQGNILALQYAGSHLVHSVRSYRKISAFHERSRDVIHSLSRYYSNTFSDADKQMAINLFLGIFRPEKDKAPIWDLSSDAYLHNVGVFPDHDFCSAFTDDSNEPKFRGHDYKALALAKWKVALDTAYARHYQVHRISFFDSLLLGVSKNTQRLQSLTSVSADSGPVHFLRSWRRSNQSQAASLESLEIIRKQNIKEKEMAAEEERVDQESSSDEEEVSSDNDTSFLVAVGKDVVKHCESGGMMSSSSASSTASAASCEEVKFDKLFPSMKEAYGIELSLPSHSDLQKYAQYCVLSRRTNAVMSVEDKLRLLRITYEQSLDSLEPISKFDLRSSSYGMPSPTVTEDAHQLYEYHVMCARQGPKMPSQKDMKIYEDYVQSRNKGKF